MNSTGGEIFHYLNEALFFALVTLVLFASSEAAYYFARHTSKNTKQDHSAPTANFGTSMLGLLALLLGFAFAMALGRFDTRKDLLIEEVNSISSAYALSELLPEQQVPAIKSLFREYTKLRIEYYTHGTLAAQMQKCLDETLKIQLQIWDETKLAMNKANQGLVNSNLSQIMMFANSLEKVCQIETKRTEARDDHVPEAILWLLIFVAIVALSINAYALGLKDTPLRLPRIFFVVAIAAVLSVILDLDRPIRGLIQIKQDVMIELHQKMSDEAKNLK